MRKSQKRSARNLGVWKLKVEDDLGIANHESTTTLPTYLSSQGRGLIEP